VLTSILDPLSVQTGVPQRGEPIENPAARRVLSQPAVRGPPCASPGLTVKKRRPQYFPEGNKMFIREFYSKFSADVKSPLFEALSRLSRFTDLKASSDEEITTRWPEWPSIVGDMEPVADRA
jgi:hypothetical protein